MIDEGYIKFELEWSRGPAPDAATVKTLNRWRQPLFDAGLIGQYEEEGIGYGNISMRSPDDGHFVISGTQTGHLARLETRHYALVTDYDIAANRVCCRGDIKASSESMTHAALYELSDGIGAVVHVHSRKLWRQYLHVLPTTRPDVSYGTPDMAGEFRRLYRDTDFAADGIAVMAGHDEGIVAFGRDMAEASQRVLTLAQSAVTA